MHITYKYWFFFINKSRVGDIPDNGQSMPITTKVASSNPIHDKAYSIHYYVIKFVSDLRQSVVFCGYFGFCHHIAELFVKVALHTITLTHPDPGILLQEFKHALIFWHNVEELFTCRKIYCVGKVNLQTKWPGILEKTQI
jgi:hypothetical protein